MKHARLTLAAGALTLAILAVSVPGSLREAREHGAFYLLSVRFFEDIPKRLAGPGRLRFLFQPATAIYLGWRAGREDARAGRRPLLYGFFIHEEHRADLFRETLEGIGLLLLMGVLMDSIFQWVLLGISYPGAALVVGPVLITVPYAVTRSIACAFRARRRPS